MRKRAILILLFISFSFLSYKPASAQESGPIYIVQAGDILSLIAERFNVSMDALMQANNITDPNQIYVGQQLIIPGLEGISGVLQTEVVNFGDSFFGLLRKTQVPELLFRRLNRIISPSQFYVGKDMILPSQENGTVLKARVSPRAGESLLEVAVRQNTDPWTLSTLNSLSGSWDGLPGDTLFTTGESGDANTSGLPSSLVNAEIRNLPIKQGGTADIRVKTMPSVTLSGTLVDNPLHFFPLEDGTQVALQGVHALLDPGVYPVRIDATLPDGSTQSYEQMVLVASGNYQKETLTVPSEYIDPAVTGPEDEQVRSIVAPVTTNRLWKDQFQIPVGLPYCLKDWFGIRRSFNGSDFDYFHAGLDYGICSPDHPFDIYAAADGTVVFSGPLTVRGNATFIDHGWGIYTAYYHQEEVYVAAGQQVQAGQLIGKIGATGRVTGPHLHWELWVNGVQVDPQDWLDQSYP